MGQNIEEWTKSNLWKTALKKFEGIYIYNIIYIGRQTDRQRLIDPFKSFKECLPQILLLPFLNTLSQIFVLIY